MSTTYTVHVKRKSDDKLIAKFDCAMLKNIVGTEFEDIINVSSFSSNGRRFTIDDLEKLSDAVYAKIERQYAEITEKKFMIACTSSTEIKNELDREIYDIKSYISDDLRWAFAASEQIRGYIRLAVVDMIRVGSVDNTDEHMAYIYNAADLPKTKSGEYEASPVLFESDVYCEVHVS